MAERKLGGSRPIKACTRERWGGGEIYNCTRGYGFIIDDVGPFVLSDSEEADSVVLDLISPLRGRASQLSGIAWSFLPIWRYVDAASSRAAFPAFYLGLEPRDRRAIRIARHVDDRLMAAGVV